MIKLKDLISELQVRARPSSFFDLLKSKYANLIATHPNHPLAIILDDAERLFYEEKDIWQFNDIDDALGQSAEAHGEQFYFDGDERGERVASSIQQGTGYWNRRPKVTDIDIDLLEKKSLTESSNKLSELQVRTGQIAVIKAKSNEVSIVHSTLQKESLKTLKKGLSEASDFFYELSIDKESQFYGEFSDDLLDESVRNSYIWFNEEELTSVVHIDMTPLYYLLIDSRSDDFETFLDLYTDPSKKSQFNTFVNRNISKLLLDYSSNQDGYEMIIPRDFYDFLD